MSTKIGGFDNQESQVSTSQPTDIAQKI